MNRYLQLEQIGEGTYGIVLKCQNKETGEIVAVKRFKEPADPNDPQYLKITQREVQMLFESRHPFIVKLIEAFKRKVRMYFVFEYCETTVLELLGKVSERDGKLLCLQLLHALQFLHARRIVHRDVKPENLLVTYHNKRPVLKLCDFGFARTDGGMMTDYVATRWYRAPELLLNSKSYSYAVDVWAFGCLLYEILTGAPLFPGDTDFNTLQMVCALCGGLPNQFLQLFQRNPKFAGFKLNVKHVKLADYVGQRLTKARKSPDSIQLLQQILHPDPEQRPSVQHLIADPYFDEVRDEVAQYEEFWASKEQVKVATQEQLTEGSRTSSAASTKRSLSNPSGVMEVRKSVQELNKVSQELHAAQAQKQAILHAGQQGAQAQAFRLPQYNAGRQTPSGVAGRSTSLSMAPPPRIAQPVKFAPKAKIPRTDSRNMGGMVSRMAQNWK